MISERRWEVARLTFYIIVGAVVSVVAFGALILW